MSEGKMIYKKIIEVMKEIKPIAKSEKNTQQHFNFRGIDAVYNALHPLLKAHDIFCTPEVLHDTVDRKELTTAKGGKMINVGMSIKFSFYTEDGSSVSVTTYGEGQDSGDKSSGKAQSMAMKQAYIQIFAIPVADAPQDRDADYTTPEPASSQSKAAELFEFFRGKRSKFGIPGDAKSAMQTLCGNVIRDYVPGGSLSDDNIAKVREVVQDERCDFETGEIN